MPAEGKKYDVGGPIRAVVSSCGDPVIRKALFTTRLGAVL